MKIPDGGVHIVGGDDGDAFIAFSSDEDARQAMMMTGKKIHNKPVSLLLSSKVEMSQVISDARLEVNRKANGHRLRSQGYDEDDEFHLYAKRLLWSEFSKALYISS